MSLVRVSERAFLAANMVLHVFRSGRSVPLNEQHIQDTRNICDYSPRPDCRQTRISMYPIFDRRNNASSPQLVVIDKKTNEKWFVFSLSGCRGIREVAIDRNADIGPCNLHPKEDNNPCEFKHPTADYHAKVKHLMETNRIYWLHAKPAPFWGYESIQESSRQTYLIISATSKADASAKMQKFLDALKELRTTELGRPPLIIVKPAFDWIGGNGCRTSDIPLDFESTFS